MYGFSCLVMIRINFCWFVLPSLQGLLRYHHRQGVSQGNVAQFAERQPASVATRVRSLPAAPSRCGSGPLGPKLLGWSINQLGDPHLASAYIGRLQKKCIFITAPPKRFSSDARFSSRWKKQNRSCRVVSGQGQSSQYLIRQALIRQAQYSVQYPPSASASPLKTTTSIFQYQHFKTYYYKYY